jgi:hypothetical protein
MVYKISQFKDYLIYQKKSFGKDAHIVVADCVVAEIISLE